MSKARHLFPFDEAMAFGFGRLHLAPQQFWAMTPRELRAALRPYRIPNNSARLTTDRLNALMRAYPDATPQRENGNAKQFS